MATANPLSCLVFLASLLVISGYGPATRIQPVASARQLPFEPQKLAEVSHLPNAYRLHEKVISGGQPEGDLGFQELHALGVKTVISVDGAQPDVASAKKYGLRYVHLPHGYDGISDERAQQLAKAVRDLPGPIYIHCHHGKHRSPAAATVACVSLGLIGPTSAVNILKTAGTSENYRGLYQSAESARRLEEKLLDALQVEFNETVALPPMAEAMVAIEHVHDHLKAIEQSHWKSPGNHPDLNPAHEALLLKEHFAELKRTDEVQRKPARFQQLIQDGEIAAGDLESALERKEKAADSGHDLQSAAAALQRITQNCSACHREFRDVPLREKLTK